MKKKKYSFLFLLPFTFYLSQGFSQIVLSPNMNCVSVAANGDVSLRWTTPVGPGSFVDYKIYSSLTPSGPFSLVGTVTLFSTTSYTHIGAGANTKRVYYLLQTTYNLGSGDVLSAPIDTFSTIFLQITNPGLNNPNLTWNQIAKNSTPTSKYKISREHPLFTWSLLDSSQTTNYIDNFRLCNDTLSYLIQLTDNSGCTSFSNVVGNKVVSIPPTSEPIDTVSVNTALIPNQATISWDPPTSPNIDSIVIYKHFGPALPFGFWNRIASVKSPLTSYTYTASTAGIASEMFRIVFKDSCGFPSPQSVEHQTIYLSATFDPCAGTASLIWNKYINMKPADPTQYEVLVSINGGPFNVIANVNGSSYTDNGLVFGTSYCYIIRATNGPKTSSSNKTCFTPNVPNPPRFNYNRFATVLSDKSILVTGYMDTSSSVTYYQIARSSGSSGVFNLLPTVIPKPSGNTITYPDKDVNTQAESYSYKWEAMNSCNKPIATSNVDTTILLKASVAPNVNIELSWNDYGSFLGGVDHYEVHRAVDGVWSSSPFPISVNYTGTGGKYTDIIDTATILHSMGVFSYYIMAIEGSGNTFGFQDSSKSNVVNVFEYPTIFVPNTFTPNGDGLNDVFKPVVGFINPSEYSLEIFDNYGYPIMKSTNPAIGWDGKMKGHKCQEGVYMYLVNCTASNGDNSQLSGTISLIR